MLLVEFRIQGHHHGFLKEVQIYHKTIFKM